MLAQSSSCGGNPADVGPHLERTRPCGAVLDGGDAVSAPALADPLGGQVQVMFDNMPTVIGAAREGKIRALAVTSAERSAAAPELPTVGEFLPGFQITSWGGLVGPAGIPVPVVERLSTLTKQALEDRELRRFFEENGATTWWTTPEELAEFRAAQQKLFADLIRASGAKVN